MGRPDELTGAVPAPSLKASRGRDRARARRERLLARGYTREDQAKIWGGNVLRLLLAAEAAKAA